MPVPRDPDESEVELSEEVEGSASQEPAEGPSDSGLDLDYAGEAPDEVDEYEAEAPPQNRDLSGFADDAGDEASYGFESASETTRYSAREFREVQEELTEDANLNDSGEYTSPFQSEPPDASGLAEVAPSARDSSENLTALPSDSSEDLVAADEAPASSDEIAAAGFTVEPEPEPEPEPAPPPRKPTGRTARPAPAAPAPAQDDGGTRPGQIAKNALDDIFNRAAKLKKQDPK